MISHTQIPYGYLRGEDGKQAVDSKNAPTVKLILGLCLQGYGPTQIARILTKKGNIPTPGIIQVTFVGELTTSHQVKTFTNEEIDSGTSRQQNGQTASSRRLRSLSSG